MTCPSRLHARYVPLIFLVGLLFLGGCFEMQEEWDQEEVDKLRITEVDRSPAIEGITTSIESIEDGAVLDSTNVNVVVTADNFETGVQTDTERADSLANSDKGQHFHLILDNKPYMANYSAGAPFELGELEPGVHTLVAFPSRSYHESVKGPGAYTFPGTYTTYDFVNFYVKEKTGEPMLNTDDPAVLYSRPKGTYSGDDADRILVDFYLHNVELSNKGYKVRCAVTAQKSGTRFARTFTEWRPAYITGTSPGTYEVTLQLLDKNGDVVPGPTNNDTTRTFVVEDPS
jgi:hypothetical protein